MKATLLLFIFILLVACAAEMKRTPTHYSALSSNASPKIYQNPTEIVVTLPTGRRKAIPSRSLWQYSGSTPEGAIFKSTNLPFMLRDANTHEAYLVISNSKLVGFYLPGEQAFVQIEQPIALLLEEK